MLKYLNIQNYAIVENLAVEFFPGLNVLTGETGAGKSILVGAVGLLLGERASTEMVRTNQETAIIEGVFVLARTGLEGGPRSGTDRHSFPDKELSEWRVRREIYRQGTGRCFINDRLVPLAQLKAWGVRIGDLCGQHQHQSLLDRRAHVRFLDERAGLQALAAGYRLAFEQLKKDSRRLERQITNTEQRRQAFELARFQLNEIRAAGLTANLEDELKREQLILRNARRLIEATESAATILSEDEGSAVDRLAGVRKELQILAKIDHRLTPIVELLTQCDIQLNEAVDSLSQYRRGVDFDPQRNEQIEERLTEIFQLKQKYGSSCREILRKLTQLEQEVAEYGHEDDQREELAAALIKQKLTVGRLATDLARRRNRAAGKLARELLPMLAQLGMPGARWQVRFTPAESGALVVPIDGTDVLCSENGTEEVEFVIETNPGEGFKPLVKIASGGELSRVMLALKAVGGGGGGADNDVSVLVFDEVDSGIGGQVAYAVAEQIKALAGRYQVFLISHLPQMAAVADHHFRVEKKKSNKRVATQVRLLNNAERVEEVARMMATVKITAATRRHAAEVVKSPPRKTKRTKK